MPATKAGIRADTGRSRTTGPGQAPPVRHGEIGILARRINELKNPAVPLPAGRGMRSTVAVHPYGFSAYERFFVDPVPAD